MKIAIVTTDFPPKKGGISHVIKNFYYYFKKENDVFVFNDLIHNPKNNIYNLIQRQGNNNFSLKNLEFMYLLIYCLLFKSKASFFKRFTPLLYFLKNPQYYFKLLNSIKALYPYFKNNKFDIIVATSIGYVTQITFFISQIFNTKAIVLTHGNDFLANMRKINHYINTTHLYNIDKIILSNENIRRIFLKLYPTLNSKKLDVVPYALILEDYKIEASKEELRKKFNYPSNKFILISIGRLVLRKNFQSVIKAINLLKDHPIINDLLYIIIGDGPIREDLIKLINKNNLENNIQLIGEISNELRNENLKLADVFIMTSYYDKKYKSIEGFGIVFLEANFYKLPTIGSYSGGIPRAIDNDKSGFLLKSYDIIGLKNKIMQLYEDKNLRKTLGEYGYKRTIEKYNWERIYLEYLKIIKKM